MESEVSFDESVTTFKSHEVNFSWRIENYSLCNKENGEFFESQAFPKSGEDKNQWCLRIYPYGYDETSKDYVSLLIKYIPKESKGCLAKHTFRFENIDETVIQNNNYASEEFELGSSSWGDRQFVKRCKVLDNLKNDVLIVSCTIVWEVGVISDDIEMVKPNVQENLLNNFSQLMENGTLSDVSLSTKDGTKFSAHKCVLTARSPVFAAMFLSDMKESKESVVKIEDVNANILKTMIKFIYTSKIDVENCDMEGLFVAADKYGIEDLKVVCEQELSKKISVENAINLLLLADRHSAKTLKTRTLKLIAKNLKDVLKTEAMKNLSITQTALFYEVLDTIADKII